MERALEEREKLRREVIRKAREWASTLKGRYSAFLIGSYARGDFNAWSDVDVLLVGEFEGNPVERLLRLDYPPGFEVVPLTREELERALTTGNPVVEDLKRKAVVLRDDLGLCKELNCSEE